MSGFLKVYLTLAVLLCWGVGLVAFSVGVGMVIGGDGRGFVGLGVAAGAFILAAILMWFYEMGDQITKIAERS